MYLLHFRIIYKFWYTREYLRISMDNIVFKQKGTFVKNVFILYNKEFYS